MIATTVDAQSARLEALVVLAAAVVAVVVINIIPYLSYPFNLQE